MVVAMVAACGQTAPPSTAPGSAPAGSPPASSQPGSTDAAGPPPSPLPVSLDDPVVALAPFEHQVRDDARAQAHLADLGPGAEELAQAVDASQVAALARIGEIAGRSSPRVALASFRGGDAPEPSNGILTWAVLLSSLDDFYRDPRSGTLELEPEERTIGGNPATVQTTLTLNATVNGDVFIADISMRTKALVRDAAGATLYSVESVAKGKVEIHFCPDASGHAPVSVSLSVSETYGNASGGAAGGTTNDYSATATITVNDDARIAGIDGSFEGDSTSQPPPAAGSTDPGPVTTVHAGDNIATDGGGHRRDDVARNQQFAGNGTVDQAIGLWAGTSLITESMVLAAAREAEKLWRDGKCVKLQLDHGDEDVQPDAVVKVTAKVHHVFENADLDKPVVASLDGVKSLDPTTKQPAPATVTYTAGHDEFDVGKVTFKTTSNRGEDTRTIRFVVRPAAWTVSFTATDTETFGPVKNQLKIKMDDLRITAAGEALTGSGELHLSGTVTSGPCSGKLDQDVEVTATGTLVGEGPEARLRLTLSTPAPTGGVVHMRCKPGGGADIPDEGHADRIGEALATIELPADGGTLAVSKAAAIGGVLTVKLKGTFTVERASS